MNAVIIVNLSSNLHPVMIATLLAEFSTNLLTVMKADSEVVTIMLAMLFAILVRKARLCFQ